LNYTGVANGGVYDSSYRAYVGGAEVLFGTTPEYGTWTVLDNITEYESLLEPGANFTFDLSAALLGGYFSTTVSISFYPPPVGAHPPSEPSKVVPLWSHYLTPSVQTLTVDATVPSDATAATLRLWTYGFVNDEFWWSLASPDRALSIQVNGSAFAAVWPNPAINTGGVDLFLWRPIPAAFTLQNRPLDTNVTGALGQLEGNHSYTATMVGRDSSSDWLVGGSILVWTNPNVTSATPTGGSSTLSGVMTTGTTTSMTTSFTWSSTLATAAGPVNVSSSQSGTFSEALTGVNHPGALINDTNWENISQTSSLVDRTTSVGPAGSTWANATRSFQIATDLSGSQYVTATTSGGYPVTANYNVSMLDLEQQWTGVSSVRSIPAVGLSSSFQTTVDNEVTGGNGVWGGIETFASASAQPNRLTLTDIRSVTPKYTSASTSGPSGTSAYSHVTSGSTQYPSDPNDAETILENRYDTSPAPLLASVSATPDPVDAGGRLVLSATTQGGAGVYTYAWTGLPGGCVSVNAATLACTPTSDGLFGVSLAVSDSLADLTVSAPQVVLVDPPLAANITSAQVAADVGGPLAFAASITGGAPPYACAWSIGGGAPNAQACTQVVRAPTSVSGTVTAQLVVTDGTGANVSATPLQVTVNSALIVTLAAVNPNATVRVGSGSLFAVSVVGGTFPVSVTWYANATVLPGLNGTTAAIVPNATGNLTLSVLVVDAAGGNATSAPLTVVVHAAASTTNPSGGGSGSGGSDLTTWLVIGLAAVAVVEAVFLLGLRRPPKTPSG
ncbi:MAG: peptide-N4-asparagine amidase, partial [Candidatus Lutacidiplasmatales archaeon]